MTNDELRAMCERVIELHRNGSPTADLWKYSESQYDDPVTGYVKRFKHLYYRYSDHLAVEGDEQAGRDFQLIAEYRKSAPALATEALRLLAQCEAMRVEVAALQMVNKALCGDNKTREMADKALEEYRRAALSQLGERT